jgi:hypothetical protein
MFKAGLKETIKDSLIYYNKLETLYKLIILVTCIDNYI